MAINLFPYKDGSASAKALALELGVKRIKTVGSKYRGSKDNWVINWGATKLPDEVVKSKVLNLFTVNASNKLNAFKLMGGANEIEYTVPWTTDKRDAEMWIKKGDKVVCRTLLSSHSGNGIIIAETLDQLVDCKLYTKYIPKDQEYRVHVMNGEAFFFQRKARKLDVPDDQVNWKIRNLAGGFIYSHKDVVPPQNVIDVAESAIDDLKLDFGAVDVITTKKGNAYVLEVNTAPGLEGTTLKEYANAFKRNYF